MWFSGEGVYHHKVLISPQGFRRDHSCKNETCFALVTEKSRELDNCIVRKLIRGVTGDDVCELGYAIPDQLGLLSRRFA